MVAVGGLTGGLGSVIGGGGFWEGFRQGIITSGLNHVMHAGLEGIMSGGQDPPGERCPCCGFGDKFENAMDRDLYARGLLDCDAYDKALYGTLKAGVQVAVAIETGSWMFSLARVGFRAVPWFALRGGYGLLGKNGLKVGTYKIEAIYMNKTGGTIFSIKQQMKGGNLLRWDYGPLHGSSGLGLHSTFRFNIGGKVYGSTAQYPWYAPFTFWKYLK